MLEILGDIPRTKKTEVLIYFTR